MPTIRPSGVYDEEGVEYYEVVEDRQVIFFGTKDECERYVPIHNEKVARDERRMRSEALRPAAIRRGRFQRRSRPN